MHLERLYLRNFRAYKGDTELEFADLTALIGRNDVGKSSILDALGVLFDHDACKIEPGDRCVFADEDDPMIIGAEFSDLPDKVVLDDASETTLAAEYLVNEQGRLEIRKTFTLSNGRLRESVTAVAAHPTAVGVEGLLLKKNTELKKLVEEADVEADRRSNVSMRGALWAAATDLEQATVEIPLNKEGAKEIWSALKSGLPLFALFRADRPSTDQEGEVQDPMKIAIQQAIAELGPELEKIKEAVAERATGVATRTLDKLSEFDPELARQLEPRFKTEPKWEGQFKLSLTGDDEIPINKRGSGVRRLVLFSFFRAEVERRLEDSGGANVIYAIEEPETSQHPRNQRLVVEAFKELAERPECQIVLTTHVPGLAGLLPLDGLRHVTADPDAVRDISTGETVIKAIAENLGVHPDLYDTRLKAFVCVEGPTDVQFFRRVSRLVREVDDSLPDLANDARVAVIPLGGSTLKDWVNQQYLRQLGKPEAHVYDRDKAGAYQAYVDKVNERGDGSWATLTSKREIENYLHPEAIREVLEAEVEVTDDNDVEQDLADLLGKGKVDRRPLKRWLAEEAMDSMTVDRLRERGGLDEIVDWFRRIGALLDE